MNFNRRDFLKIGFLSASAMTFTACGRPVEHGIVSQYQMPEYKVLGQPSYWATTCTELRSDCCVSVKTVENRAIHVLGMPNHFFTKGGATTSAIASLTTLYHPDRLREPVSFKPEEQPGEVIAKALSKSGTQPVFITNRMCGSSGDALLALARAVGGRIWVCDSQNSIRERRILKAVVGRAELPLLDLENRDYFVTVGSNCIGDSYTPTRTDWAYGRFRKTPGKLRGRMVSISSRMNTTDANADLWIPVRPGSESVVLGALGTLLQEKGKGNFPQWASVTPQKAAEAAGVAESDRKHFIESLENLASRLAEANSPLVIGGFQGPNGDATVYLAHTITKMLNGDVPTFEPDNFVGESKSGDGIFLADGDVLKALESSKAVFVDDVDVLYRFPWLTEAFKKVKTRIVCSVLPTETTDEATHVLPLKTWLEDWGDILVTSKDGNWYGLTQPAVRNQIPAAQSRLGLLLAMAESLKVKLGNGQSNPRKYLMRALDQGEWEDLQVRAGHWEEEPDLEYPYRGMYPPPPTPNAGSLPTYYNAFSDLPALQVSALGDVPAGKSFTVLHTHLADGHMAHSPWLQELPDAMTTVVWDSWIEINANEAKRLGIARHDLVEVSVGGTKIKGSAYPSPFIHTDLVGIPAGRGQKRQVCDSFAKIGWTPQGSNPKVLLSGKAGQTGSFSDFAEGATLTKGSGSRLLATFDERVYNLPRHILPE